MSTEMGGNAGPSAMYDAASAGGGGNVNKGNSKDGSGDIRAACHVEVDQNSGFDKEVCASYTQMNRWPGIALTSPEAGARRHAGTPITLSAHASYPDMGAAITSVVCGRQPRITLAARAYCRAALVDAQGRGRAVLHEGMAERGIFLLPALATCAAGFYYVYIEIDDNAKVLPFLISR